MPTEISQNDKGARPKEHEHVYNYPKEKCMICNEITIHKCSIKWGNGDYKQTKTCGKCNHLEVIPVTKEFCASITPLVLNAS